MNDISRIFSLMNQGNPFVEQFERFRKSYTGDPRQQIQQMLDSGKLSQEDFNKLAQRASELRKILPR